MDNEATTIDADLENGDRVLLVTIEVRTPFNVKSGDETAIAGVRRYSFGDPLGDDIGIGSYRCFDYIAVEVNVEEVIPIVLLLLVDDTEIHGGDFTGVELREIAGEVFD